MATIWDVAKLAGVSKSTVSRVINKGSCSPEAKEAVLAAIKKLNYQPSCFAQNIRTQKSMTIALMVPDASNLFYTELFKSIQEVAYRYQYMVILFDTQNSPEYEIKYAQKLINRKIDGLIYGTYKMDAKTQDFFVSLSQTLPTIFIDYAYIRYNNISIVATEGFESTRSAVHFLFQKGRRSIAYVNFPQDVEVTRLRFQGYIRGLEDCGLPYSSDLVYLPDAEETIDGRTLGYNGAKALLSSGRKIDAFMAAADHLAIGVIKYLKQEKIKIPDDISVIGFDNNALCDVVEPTLTTIAQPIREIGTTAMHILMNKIQNDDNTTKRIFLKGKLVERNST